jgi:p-aminobenzoyl-glutamate transporter AbgT
MSEERKTGSVGKFLNDQLTPEKKRSWKIAFFAILAVVALLNLIIRTGAPHFGLDAYPFFWAAFGLVIGVAMVFLVKKIIQPLIKRSEDYYGDL